MSKMKRRVAMLMVLTLFASIFGAVQWGSVSRASDEPVNVALASNGTTISTSAPDAWCENNGYGVANMINGNTGGVYGVTAAHVDYEHKETKIQLDFQQVYSVSKVQLYKTAEEAFPVDFTISVYTTDGWKTVISKEGYQSLPGCNTFEFAPVDCKSVRLISTRNGEHTGDGKYAIYLQEFEVYGVSSNTVIPAEPSTVNVAASANGGTISTSHPWVHASTYGVGLENIIDGTRAWGATLADASYQNEPMNLDITFNQEYRVNKAMLYVRYDDTNARTDGFPKDFEIQVYSNDNWVTVAKRTDYKALAEWNTFEFDDITCSAIRLATTENGLTNDGKYGIYLDEFEVYGYEAPKVNVASVSNGATTSTSHPDAWGEPNGYGVATLNDGKTAGYWFITENKTDYQNTHMSVTTLLDKAYKVNEVSLYPVGQGGFPEDFTIDVYTQNGWETVVTKTGYVATTGEQNFVFDAIDARAVRLNSTKNGAIDQGEGKADTYGIYLFEFEVYGKASSEVIDAPSNGNEPTPPPQGGEEEPPVEDTRINVALTSEIETTHPNTWGEDNGFGIANMTDGKATTGTYGITQETKDDQNTQMSITLTFDKTYKVDEACLYAVADGGFPEDFVLEAYTKDGWKTVVTKDAYVAEVGKQSFVFEAVDCRMFRLTTTKNGLTGGEKYGIFLQEFEVYGKESDIVINLESSDGAQDKPSGETLQNIAAASNGSTISTTHPDAWGENNGFGIANMIDGKGNAGNYGITAATPELQNTQISISVNFKQAYKVSKICLYSVEAGGFPEDFTLAAYTKAGWKTVLTKRGYKAEAGCQTFEITPIDCSAVKLISTKNGVEHQGKYGIYLLEFEVYGEVSSVSIPKAPGLGTEGAGAGTVGTNFSYNAEKNLALNMPVTCNSDYAQYGFGINNVNDGNLDSPWSCNMLLVEKDKPEWVEINLLGNYKINTVALYARENGWGFPKDIKISVFYDDNWIEVVDVKNYKVSTDVKATAEYVFKFKETIGNKIRIEGSNFNMADGEYGMQLTEIAVYGDVAIGDYILPLNNYVSSATDITTSSTLEDFGFFTLYLTDGDVKTGYSSNQHTDPNNIEWIELDLKRTLSIGSILLKPAVAGSGFPVDFEIQVMVDGKWETIHKVTDYKKPVDESWQQFVLDEQYRTDKVRIWVTKLGDDFGQYSLRLNEIEIYPSEITDKDMEAVQVGNTEYATYNSAHTVETKTIIPTALIVSGVVVAATAFVGIVGVYILTLRKMKRKEE